LREKSGRGASFPLSRAKGNFKQGETVMTETKKARPDEAIGSAGPGSKQKLNKSVPQGNQKIKQREELVIVGKSGHRYYSTLKLRDTNIRISEERGRDDLIQDPGPARKLNLTAEEIGKKLRGGRHAKEQNS